MRDLSTGLFLEMGAGQEVMNLQAEVALLVQVELASASSSARQGDDESGDDLSVQSSNYRENTATLCLADDVSLVQMKQKKFFLFAASMDSEQVRAIGAQDLSSQEQVALFADQVSGVTTVARFAEIQQELTAVWLTGDIPASMVLIDAHKHWEIPAVFSQMEQFDTERNLMTISTVAYSQHFCGQTSAFSLALCHSMGSSRRR